MAIFDRNYDRDYGYRGGGAYQGDDRDLGDRVRQGWNRVKEGARDAFDRDDDRGYGHRGGAYGAAGYDRDFGNRDLGDRDYGTAAYGNYGYGAGGGSWQRPGGSRLEPESRDVYDRDRSWYAGRGGGMGMGGAGAWNYDRDFDRGTPYSAYERDARYDREYKSRWQTDQGDPFGDRANRTPIRMTRGEFHNYDADFGRTYGAGSGTGYDRDLGRGYNRGVGYDPYDADDARLNRGGWGAAGRNRGYDRGWF